MKSFLIIDELETPGTCLFLHLLKTNKSCRFNWVCCSQSQEETLTQCKKWGISTANATFTNLFSSWASLDGPLTSLNHLFEAITTTESEASDTILIDDISVLLTIFYWKDVLIFIDRLWQWVQNKKTALVISCHSDLTNNSDLDLFRKSLQYTFSNHIYISKLSQGTVQGITGQIKMDSQLILYELGDSGFTKWLTKGNV